MNIHDHDLSMIATIVKMIYMSALCYVSNNMNLPLYAKRHCSGVKI